MMSTSFFHRARGLDAQSLVDFLANVRCDPALQLDAVGLVYAVVALGIDPDQETVPLDVAQGAVGLAVGTDEPTRPTPRFTTGLNRLTPEQRHRFRQAADSFVDDLRTGRFHAGLREASELAESCP
ncbi:hypothetical protein [Streptomyces sp. TE33382]